MPLRKLHSFLFGRSNSSQKAELETPVPAMQSNPNATNVRNSLDSAGDLFASAVELHKQGNLDQAERLYLDVIQIESHNADAMQYLGMLNGQRGFHDKAIEYFQQALAISPQHFAALSNLGKTYLDLGRLDPALEKLDHALQLRPDAAQLWLWRGNTMNGLHRNVEACESYRRVLQIRPELLDAHINLASTLKELGQLQEAATAFRDGLKIVPDFAEMHANLGIVLGSLGQLDEAVESYRRAVELKPDLAEAHNNLGSALKDQGQFELAAASFQRALEINPGFAEAHINMVGILVDLGRPDEAVMCCNRALEVSPDSAVAHFNMGRALKDLDQLDHAIISYRHALEMNPEFPEVHYNLGILFVKARRLDEAEVSYMRALEIKSDYADATWNLGLLLLAQGRYSEAWPLHEARYGPKKTESSTVKPTLPFPQWRGESLVGKSLLIWPEQGFGDYIQFVRYAPLLKELGVSRLTLFCLPPLKPLLETVAGVDAVITDGDFVALHDYWTFPLSLPLHFGTTVDTIPVNIPYLQSLPDRLQRWRNYLPENGMRVGLVWKGSTLHKNDANRSLPGLAVLAPLWSIPGVTFVSLQKWQAEDDAVNASEQQPILHLGTDIVDFADTAAIVAQLDLVICVDTAIAHLAGAMGKLCWVLLPSVGLDWRWLLERSDSPWYPNSIRLFRQATPGDWTQTVGEVADALRQKASRDGSVGSN